MPVFQVRMRSANGVTGTAPRPARSKASSSQNFTAWSRTQAIRATTSPKALSAPQMALRRASPRAASATPLLRRLAHIFPLTQSLSVARRDVGIFRIGADRRRDFPRPGAFFALGAARLHRNAAHVVEPERRCRSLALDQSRRRGDAELREIATDRDAEQLRISDVNDRRRLQRGADALGGALELERAGDGAAEVAQLAPFFGQD